MLGDWSLAGRLNVDVLGPFEVSVDGGPVELTTSRLRTVLAVLAQWRVPVLVVVVMVVSSLISGEVPAAAATPPPSGPAPATTEPDPGDPPAPPDRIEDPSAKALAKARRTGKRVEVVSERSETRDVYANPDGTFTAVFSLEPKRVKRSGRWVPVDTTLYRRADGRVAPRASTAEVSFSGGGDRAMVSIREGAREIALSWPKPLPEPVLTGDTATYREVFPGVDLRLKATRTGLYQVLVVKDRTAAKNPRLANLAFGLAGKGVSFRSDKSGDIVGRDTSGRRAFGIKAPMTWDSATPEPRRAVGEHGLSGDRVVMSPNREFFDDPDVAYPLYIEPAVAGGWLAWTMVMSGNPDTEYWNGQNDGDGVAKVGYCGFTGCNGIGAVRSYFKFDIRSMAGKHVLSASFSAFQRYAPSCSGLRPVSAYGTARVWSTTNWTNQPYPSTGVYLGSNTEAYGYGTGSCAPNWIEFNVLRAMDLWMSKDGTATVMLKGADETDRMTWRKYDVGQYRPTMSFTYNSYPSTPVSLTSEGKACALDPGEPYVNPYATGGSPRGPKLAAKVSDADGRVAAEFEWYVRGGSRLGVKTTATGSSGATFTVEVPAAHATDGAKLRWRVRGADGIDVSAWGGWCDVTIDRTPPQAAPLVSSTMYPYCSTVPGEPCPAGGGVGQTGAFTFRPNGATGVVGYQFGLDQGVKWFVAAGANGEATGYVTPPKDGRQTLFVRMVDKANNPGPMTQYGFFVGTDLSPPKGHWRMEGWGNEKAVRDSSAGAHHGSFTTGAAWRNGRHGDALWFNGAGAVTTSNGPAVDTSKTFTVAAWAKLDKLGGFPAVVSQDSSHTAAFQLQGTPEGEWAFTMFTADVDGGGTPHYRVRSASPIRLGVWTHLIGFYDSATGVQRIYVNGVLENTITYPRTGWPGTGPVTIARSMWKGNPADIFPGTVDEVRIYDRGLAEAEIHDLAGLPAAEELFLPLDEGAGSRAVDVAGNFRNGTVGVGASWAAGRVGTGSLSFAGGTDTVSTTGPVVRPDGSFTVTVWAMLTPDGTPGTTEWRSLLSQDGTQASGFELYRGSSGKWGFALSKTDTAGAAMVTAEQPGEDYAYEEEWTHLAGVYDAADRKIRLYVNGVAVASQDVTHTPWNAAGPFRLGAARAASAVGKPFLGRIDDVHVWTGVRTGDQIQDEMENPVVERTTAYTSEIARYWHNNGFSVVTPGAVPPGSHFLRSLGLPAPAGDANTRPVYSCKNNDYDYFLSLSSGCETRTVLGPSFYLYRSQPVGVPTVPVYRCLVPMDFHFASNDDLCEGHTMEGLLGYALAYGNLARSVRLSSPDDRMSTAFGTPGDYEAEGALGMVALTEQVGTTALLVCDDNGDSFTSTDPACEGKTVVQQSGFIWTAPPDGVTASQELFRCSDSRGDLFDSLDRSCEGGTLDRSLGYVVTAP